MEYNKTDLSDKFDKGVCKSLVSGNFQSSSLASEPQLFCQRAFRLVHIFLTGFKVYTWSEILNRIVGIAKGSFCLKLTYFSRKKDKIWSYTELQNIF